MPFCTTCGADVQGKFCVKCGAPAGAPAAAPRPVAAPVPAAAPPAAKKKTSPLVWILVGVVALFVLIGVAVVGVGLFAVHKAKQAGFDPGLMEKNPALAVTKMMAAANPDIEVVRVDEGSGEITLREKSTGKVTTVDFEDIKKGRISFRQDGKEALTIQQQGDGESGSFEMKSGDESVRIGGGAAVKIPGWLPRYPGATIAGRYMRQAGTTESGAFDFTTSDSPEKVLEFYSQGLKASGLRITQEPAAHSEGGMLGAEDGTRKAAVIAGAANGNTSVAVTFEVSR